MNVLISDSQSDLKINRKKVEEIVKEVIIFEGAFCDEVSVNFVHSDEICRIHEEYFNDSSVTDCISFPIDSPNKEEFCVLGEIFVCPKTAIDYALENKLDPYNETTLYIIHGLLHLLGYKDNSPKNISVMRKKEQKHILNLDIKGLKLK